MDMVTNFNNCISMKNGSSIEHVKECVHLGNTISLKCIGGKVFLIYLFVQIVYYMTFQTSIVAFYLYCITHIWMSIYMVANYGNLIVSRMSINFTLHMKEKSKKNMEN